MATSVHRVVVRGHFADLGADQRAALLAEADQHDIFDSAFTADGTFTYDDRLVAFNLRYEIRTDDEADPPVDPIELGTAKAIEALEGWGLEFKHLRASATDMSRVWD